MDYKLIDNKLQCSMTCLDIVNKFYNGNISFLHLRIKTPLLQLIFLVKSFTILFLRGIFKSLIMYMYLRIIFHYIYYQFTLIFAKCLLRWHKTKHWTVNLFLHHKMRFQLGLRCKKICKIC